MKLFLIGGIVSLISADTNDWTGAVQSKKLTCDGDNTACSDENVVKDPSACLETIKCADGTSGKLDLITVYTSAVDYTVQCSESDAQKSKNVVLNLADFPDFTSAQSVALPYSFDSDTCGISINVMGFKEGQDPCDSTQGQILARKTGNLENGVTSKFLASKDEIAYLALGASDATKDCKPTYIPKGSNEIVLGFSGVRTPEETTTGTSGAFATVAAAGFAAAVSLSLA